MICLYDTMPICLYAPLSGYFSQWIYWFSGPMNRFFFFLCIFFWIPFPLSYISLSFDLTSNFPSLSLFLYLFSSFIPLPFHYHLFNFFFTTPSVFSFTSPLSTLILGLYSSYLSLTNILQSPFSYLSIISLLWSISPFHNF